MLIAKEDVTIRYNSKEFILKAGDKFDVRDFDVPNAGVVNTEKHVMKKNAGKLEITSAKADSVDNVNHQKEIKALKVTINDLQDQLKALADANEELVQKHAAMAGEVGAAKQEAQSLRKDMPRVLKENEDLKDEVEKLRLRTTKKDK